MYPRNRYPSKRNRTSTVPTVGGLVPEVRMSVEEYLQLVNADSPPKKKSTVGRKAKKITRSGKKDPKMAKALKMANDKARKKNGSYKKGYDQAKLMSLAHKIRRKL